VKKQGLNPSPDKGIPEDIEFRENRDLMGYIPNETWSCLTLDAADKAAPLLGKEGYALYYYMAQAQEALATKYQGEGEAEAFAYVQEHYVKWSEDQGKEVNRIRLVFLARALTKVF